MGMIGTQHAITAEQERQLMEWHQEDDQDSIFDLVDEIDNRWYDADIELTMAERLDFTKMPLSSSVDKAWYEIDLCFSEDPTRLRVELEPLANCIFGGVRIAEDGESMVNLIDKGVVLNVAKAFQKLKDSDVDELFYKITDSACCEKSKENLEYVRANIESLRYFFAEAAKREVAMISAIL